MSNENQIEMPLEEETDGVIILDPEMKKQQEEKEAKQKAKFEAMQATNKAINEALETISKEYGMKLVVAGFNAEFDDMGIWKSSNVTTFDEMALTKLIETQF